MKLYSQRVALAVIIANMIGSGILTSLGYQLVTIQSVFAILLLWLLGGIAALTGAMSYAELGCALPKSGGEYQFLGRIYHPAAGFISGWVSATIGFAAPVAAVAIAFGAYIVSISPAFGEGLVKPLAVSIVLIATWFHTRNHRQSGFFQISFTALKILVIVIFCIAALILVPAPQPVTIRPAASDLQTVLSADFAVALIFVVYSYTGWNAATYILGEMAHPQRDLPRILIIGTSLVTCLYILLNYVFLKTAPMPALMGQTEIAVIAGQYAFGDQGGRAIGLMLALLLISSVSAMTLAGPRAIQAIGEDYTFFKSLGHRTENNLPLRAILLQSLIAVIFILTSSFKSILILAGGLLAFNSFLAVLGVIILRLREPELLRPYRTPCFPLIPLIFLLITGFTLVYVIRDNLNTALFAGGIIALASIVWVLSGRMKPSHPAQQGSKAPY